MKKSLLVCAIATLGLSACVQTPVRPGSSSSSLLGQLTSINGVAAYAGGTFEMGRFSGLPRARTSEDMSALSGIIKFYRDTTVKAVRNGDYEAAMMANHLAAKFADYQSSLAAGSRAAVQSMLDHGTGNIDLPAGAYAILPAFDRYEEESIKFSFADWPYGPAHEVAVNDLDTKMDIAQGILNLVSDKPRTNRQRTTKSLGIEKAMSLPLNQPYTLTNGAVLERTKDSFILHNPGVGPVRVDVQKLGYLPPIRTPSNARKIAGQILAEMNRTTFELVWEVGNVVGGINVEPPNKVLFTRLGGAARPAAFHIEGRLARNAEEVLSSKRAYETPGSPFRLAMDSRYGMEKSLERNQFRSQCFAMARNVAGGYFFLDFLKGTYGEIVDLQCVRKRSADDKEGELIYSRRYYVTDSGQVKSWESLMRDQETANKLKDLDQTIEARENIVQLLGFLGNVESGLKCTNSTTMSKSFTMYNDPAAAALDSKRSFVSDIYSMDADSSAFDRASNCASALPVLGSAAKLGLKAAELASLGKYVDGFGKPLVSAMKFFDEGLLAQRGWDTVAASLPLKSQQSMDLAKWIYDSMQKGKNLADLAESLKAFTSSST